jgi:hypothetical protein
VGIATAFAHGAFFALGSFDLAGQLGDLALGQAGFHHGPGDDALGPVDGAQAVLQVLAKIVHHLLFEFDVAEQFGDFLRLAVVFSRSFLRSAASRLPLRLWSCS